MQKIMIPIDRSSIRRDRRAGETSSVISGDPTIIITIERNGLRAIYESSGKLSCSGGVVRGEAILNEWTSDGGEAEPKQSILFLIEGDKLFNLTDGSELARSFTVRSNSVMIEHSPIPEYLFRYADPRIECQQCGKEPLASSYRDGDDFDCCPFCCTPVEIVLEPIESVSDVFLRL